MKDTRFFTLFRNAAPRRRISADAGAPGRFSPLRVITLILAAFLIFQAYNHRHWFRNIPGKAAVRPSPARPETTAGTPPAKPAEKEGLRSLLPNRGKPRQDEIFALDARLDSLFREFNVEKNGVNRRIKNFPAYFLEEKVLLPRGKPLPEYLLSVGKLLSATPYTLSDCVWSEKDSSVVLEISREDKVLRRMVLAYGRTYQAGYARMAVVLEGLGMDLDDRIHGIFSSIRYPVTVAVIPAARYAGRICEMARKNGWEIICQVPMESLPYRYLGGSAVYKHFEIRQVTALIAGFEEEMPDACGYSIFGGGIRIVENEPEILRAFLGYAKKKDRFFMDNSFAQHSRAVEIGSTLGVQVLEPPPYSDRSIGPEAQKAAAARQIAQIRRTGQGIMLIRDPGQALPLVTQALALAGEQGVKLVTVSTLLQ